MLSPEGASHYLWVLRLMIDLLTLKKGCRVVVGRSEKGGKRVTRGEKPQISQWRGLWEEHPMWKRGWRGRGTKCSCSCSVCECVCVCRFTGLLTYGRSHMEAITSGAGEGVDYSVTDECWGLPWQTAESCWWSVSFHLAPLLSSSKYNATSFLFWVLWAILTVEWSDL